MRRLLSPWGLGHPEQWNGPGRGSRVDAAALGYDADIWAACQKRDSFQPRVQLRERLAEPSRRRLLQWIGSASVLAVGPASLRTPALGLKEEGPRPARSTARFQREVFERYFAEWPNAEPLTREAITIVQTTLWSLGYEIGPSWADGDFGGATRGALKKFQADQGLRPTGQLDIDSLIRLDAAAAAQRRQLEAGLRSPAEKKKYSLIADLSGAPHKIFVVDSHDEPVAVYLTSPGKNDDLVAGSYYLGAVKVRDAWNPTQEQIQAARARGKALTRQEGGALNPMGLVKVRINGGRSPALAIHGTPPVPAVEQALAGGLRASNGCLRLSKSNILELVEQYAGHGTVLKVIDDKRAARSLQKRAEARGLSVRPLDAGREYFALYAYDGWGGH